MLDKNDKLTEMVGKLNHENKVYFENFAEYMKKNVFYSKNVSTVAEMLTEVCQDIYAAQNDGINAVAYFGKNPQEIADGMLAEMKIATGSGYFGKTLSGVMMISSVSILMLVTGWREYFTGLLPMIFIGFMCIVYATFVLVTRKVYDTTMVRRQTNLLMVIFAIIGVGMIASMILLDMSRFHFPFPFVIRVLVIVLLLLVFGLFVISEKKKHNLTKFLPSFLFCTLQGILGIISHSPLRHSLMTEDIHFAWFMFNVVLMSGLTFYLSNRQKKKAMK